VLTPSSLACLAHVPTVNLTAGYAHECRYCYARGYLTHPGEGKVRFYANTLTKLREELRRKRKGRNVDRIQKCHQHLLRKALRESRVITSLDVAAGRRIHVTRVAWEEHWGDCGSLARQTAELKAAWTALISGSFSDHLRLDFVRTYFQ